MTDYAADIKTYLNKDIEVLQKLDIAELNDALAAIAEAWQRNANIYTMGNGGSAATASHMVCDFNKGISDGKSKRFRLQCLSDNIPTLMAISNDIGYEDIFLHQLQGILTKNDLIIAISGSGNSANVIKAVEYAKEEGCKVVGVTGYDGGKLRKLADYSMHVPADDMQVAEDLHMVFDHMMMRVFCERLK